MSYAELSDSLKQLAGPDFSCAALQELGPGMLYLLELPSLSIRYLSRDDADFPKAFLNLVESLDSWDQLVVESERDPYRAAVLPDAFQSRASYRVAANRRGETLPVKDYRQLVRDADGAPVGIVGRLVDDSFRAVAMDSLARRSWKEIAATMTRRFLHDFNNTIAGIYSLSELYADMGADPKSTTEAMRHIRDASMRAQAITQQIRHLTTLEPGQASYFDLADLLREQNDYLRALLPKGAAIEMDLADGQHPIRIDPNLFRQAVLHLASNAYDAAGESVALALRLAQRDDGDRSLACLEFRDNGPGFKPSELKEACSPFFTTKDNAKHPGLGLSIVRDFAEKLGGSIRLENGNPGAVVRLELPLLAKEKPKAPADSKPGAPAKPARKSAAKPAANGSQTKPAPLPPNLLVYSWEDIARHPLLLALQKQKWQTRVLLDPGDLLVELAQPQSPYDGVLVFKSALDERADPLISELGRARNCRKLALLTLGESVDALPPATKSHCGLIASGSSKPSALLAKLSAYFR